MKFVPLLLSLLFLGLILASPPACLGDEPVQEGWINLFNGKDLTGWKLSENGKIRVEDGKIVASGRRSHLFTERAFKNFEFVCEAMTTPGSNSGIFFHTKYVDSWPTEGYEVQVNCTHRDPVKNGSLWGVVKSYDPIAKDNEWFEVRITVRGQNIVTHINGKLVVDYTEPPGVSASRRIGEGAIALQSHDPRSVTYYRNVRVKPLDDQPARRRRR